MLKVDNILSQLMAHMIHLLELLRHFFLLVGKLFNDSRALVQHLLDLSQLGLEDCLSLLALILAFGI